LKAKRSFAFNPLKPRKNQRGLNGSRRGALRAPATIPPHDGQRAHAVRPYGIVQMGSGLPRLYPKKGRLCLPYFADQPGKK
jgi:hypothetical protein